jgi:hypothetical protein
MYLSCWQETSAASSPTSALSSNANQLDRPARSDRVLLRRGHKLLVAPLGAKVIGLPLVLLARRGRGRVDLHPAHRVGHRRHHLEQNDVLAEPAHPLDVARWVDGAPSMPVDVGCSRMSFVTPWPLGSRVRAAPRPNACGWPAGGPVPDGRDPPPLSAACINPPSKAAAPSRPSWPSCLDRG